MERKDKANEKYNTIIQVAKQRWKTQLQIHVTIVNVNISNLLVKIKRLLD
jgi:hypothetical protein